jgi:geranylgeranyl transferase type-1 subunit beta
MVLYFILEALDVLDKLQDINPQRKQLVNYVYSLQLERGGFICSSLYRSDSKSNYSIPHIVFSYSAINCLKILGDDLSRLNKKALIDSVVKCQRPDGSFSSFHNTDEADLRFVYAAVAICTLVGDTTSIDIPLIEQYVRSCYNFDGGFGLRPNC